METAYEIGFLENGDIKFKKVEEVEEVENE